MNLLPSYTASHAKPAHAHASASGHGAQAQPHAASSLGQASGATQASPSLDSAGLGADSTILGELPAESMGPSAYVAHPLLDALKGSATSFATMPNFLYPAVSGTAAERSMIYSQLDRLPLKDVGSVSTVHVVDAVPTPGGGVVMGYEQPMTADITLSRQGCSLVQVKGGDWTIGPKINPTVLQGTLTHEVGHAADYSKSLARSLTGLHPSAHAPFGQGPSVTEYATTTPQEDFAETYARVHLTPKQLAGQPNAYETQPLETFNKAKADAMKAFDKQSVTQRLVDTKAFRATGREFGTLTSALPGMRTGMLMAGRLSSFGLLMTGASEIMSGIGNHSKVGTVQGALNLGAGVSLGLSQLGPVFAPAAMALLGANAGVHTAEAQAAKHGTRARAKAETAAAVGGAVGGGVGGFAGPLAGTRLGYAVGGPVGGVIGMIAGGLLGYSVASKLGAKAGLAVSGGNH
jgi:hypothetical protein